jgi:hypothetical protein
MTHSLFLRGSPLKPTGYVIPIHGQTSREMPQGSVTNLGDDKLHQRRQDLVSI